MYIHTYIHMYIYVLFYVYECVVCRYVNTPFVHYPQTPEEGIRFLILELHMIVIHYVGSGNQTQVLSKRAAISPVQLIYF